jgi:hypothetical protein
MDEEKPQPGSVETGGGASIEGDVELTGGDFIGRDKAVHGDEVRGDKYVQINQLDIGKLVQALRETLPSDDDTPLALIQTLRSFQVFHSRLFEWKELHNFLNDISFSMSQLSREVERVEAQGSPINRRMLARLWRPIGNLVLAMLEWAASVEYIAEQPFSEMGGGFTGPAWAVETQVASQRLESLLDNDHTDVQALYDGTFDFVDTIERHLYLADKKLRDTAGELYNLSRIALGSVGDVEI